VAVRSVFVSSVIDHFEPIRAGAATGIERVGMHSVMAERMPAAASSPRRALLDEAGGADAYLLLLGERYGAPGSGGKSPTEEEYEEAIRKGRPILVLVQDCKREAEQDAFLERIRGCWDSGVLYDRFTDASDVAVAVAGALARHQSSSVENLDRAEEQANLLVRDAPDRGYMSSGVGARIAMVPLREALLLDPIALEDADLAEELMAGARAAGLVAQNEAIVPAISSEGVGLTAKAESAFSATEIAIGTDGAICVSASVQGSGNFGGSLVDPGRLRDFLIAAARFGRAAWQLIDKQEEVGRVAVTAAIPEAQNTCFGVTSGSSISMGHGVPNLVLAFETPQAVPRGQVDGEEQIRRLVAGIKRVYLDAGAVQEGA
jgi:Domain of unknown function (DUF4062)